MQRVLCDKLDIIGSIKKSMYKHGFYIHIDASIFYTHKENKGF